MREIPLTQGKVALVDDDDFARLAAFKWRAGSGGYACRSEGGRVIWMHREVAAAPDGVEVDHVNRNGVDNRRANLRHATRKENMRNRGYTRVRPGLRGASFHRGRWRAVLVVDARQVPLGYFDSELNAGVAYDAGARLIFGEFANLNFGAARDWILPASALAEGERRARDFLARQGTQGARR